MTIADFIKSRLPDYYDTMYLDGYTPQEIVAAASATLYKEYQERNNPPYEVVIKQEVVKK